jgi:hypothetical protein
MSWRASGFVYAGRRARIGPGVLEHWQVVNGQAGSFNGDTPAGLCRHRGERATYHRASGARSCTRWQAVHACW